MNSCLIKSGDIVMIRQQGKDYPKVYGLVIGSISTHYDERYRIWAVLIEDSVKNISESWIVTLDSK